MTRYRICLTAEVLVDEDNGETVGEFLDDLVDYATGQGYEEVYTSKEEVK